MATAREILDRLEEGKVGTDCRPWTGNGFSRTRVCRYGSMRSFYSGGDKTPYNFKNTYGDGTEESGGPFDNASDSEKAATKAYQKWFSGVKNASDIRGNW